MTCVDLLYKRLIDELSKNGYRILEIRYKWGIELTIESHGEMTTINIYTARGENTIIVEVSSVSNYNDDFNVDIFDCNCNEQNIESCINEIKSSLNSFLT